MKEYIIVDTKNKVLLQWTITDGQIDWFMTWNEKSVFDSTVFEKLSFNVEILFKGLK